MNPELMSILQVINIAGIPIFFVIFLYVTLKIAHKDVFAALMAILLSVFFALFWPVVILACVVAFGFIFVMGLFGYE